MKVVYRTNCCGKIVGRREREKEENEKVYSCEGCDEIFRSNRACLDHEDVCPRYFKEGDKVRVCVETRHGPIDLHATVKALERDQRGAARVLTVSFDDQVFPYDSVRIRKIIPGKPVLDT